EERGVNAAGEIAKVLEGLGDFALGLLEQVVCLSGILRPELAGEAYLHRQRDELLLCPVMDVALEAASLGVLRGDQTLARRPELFQACQELLGQVDVPKDQPRP